MDCLTTYRDDYLCRDGGAFGVKPNNISNPYGLYNEILCGCGVKPDENVSVIRASPLETDSYEWSRLGPMGYILEPKLYPINICSTPVMTTENSVERKSFLKTIDDKCFDSLNIVPIAPLPTVDILRRLNNDRLRSTYQTDFNHMDDYPWADYDNSMVSAHSKSGHKLEKPEKMICSQRPKRPHLNGHKIPGGHSKERNLFSTFVENKKRRSEGPEGSKLPPSRERTQRALQQSKDYINDDIGDDHKYSTSDHQKEQNKMLNNRTVDERERILREITPKDRTQVLTNATGNIRAISDERSKNTGQQGSIIKREIPSAKINDKISINGQRSYKINGKEVGKINKEMENSRKYVTSRSDKVKNNTNELHLISSMPWTSEYQDIISRNADEIMKTKLHYYGKLRLLTPNPDCL